MRYLLVLFGLLITGTAEALDCRETPDCSAMGYSQEDNPDCQENGYIYCPFDTSYKKCVNYKCEALGFTKEDKSSWCNKLIKCKGDTSYTLCQNLCEVGDVYYADGTCGYAKDYDPNNNKKIPVGVVYWVTDEGRHGKVVALQNAKTVVQHYYYNDIGSSNETMPIGELKYYETMRSYISSENISAYQNREPDFFNGKKNTAQMVKNVPIDAYKTQCENGIYQKDTVEWERYCQSTAALRCLEYAPSDNPKTGKGNWYLPALGEWLDLYGFDAAKMSVDSKGAITGATGSTKAIIDQTFKVLGKNIGSPWDWVWTSTYTQPNLATFNILEGWVSSDSNWRSHTVRPMLEF